MNTTRVINEVSVSYNSTGPKKGNINNSFSIEKKGSGKNPILLLCPEGGEAVVSGERGFPAGDAGEYQKILLDGEDHND